MKTWLSAAPKVLQNSYMSLEIAAEAGPRILRLIPAGTNLNLLAELPDLHWSAPAGEYYLLGGHRLWASPENPEITYLPDDKGVKLDLLNDGVRLSRRDLYGVSIEKILEIRLDKEKPLVNLLHRIRNLAEEPLTVAPWAISMLPLGSRLVLPMAVDEIDAHGLRANRSIALWPYSRLQDPRLEIAEDRINVKGEALPNALKIGVYSPRGWAAAETQGWLLIKRFDVEHPDAYPDMNSNLEAYVRDRFLEFETLGTLKTLQAGQSVDLAETWEIRPGKLEDLDAVGQVRA